MRIVGLKELKRQLETIEEKADVYRKGGAKVPNIVMNLTCGNGQSIVADYITSALYENNLRKFCGLDNMLEYRFDGTLKQMKQVFEDIASNAVYTNEYEGVVAVDISALAGYINEFQIEYFIEKIVDISQNATLIVYYDASIGKRMQIVKDRTIMAIGNNCIDIFVKPYSFKEYSEMIVQDIREKGIEIECEKELKIALCKVLEKHPVKNAKQAAAVANDLAFCVDYGSFTSRINVNRLNEYFDSRVCL